MRSRPLFHWASALAALTAALALVVVLAQSAAASSQAAPLAPALDGATSGGAVIVWLKNQHSNINLRKHFARRRDAAYSDQSPLIADIRKHGGSDITQLVSVNAVAAHLPADEVQRLSENPNVKEILPDASVSVPAASPATTVSPSGSLPLNSELCPTDPSRPLIEPEALSIIHAASTDPNDPGDPTDMANSIATGRGVIVANDGIDDLAGNPNFIRPDGSHVVIDASNNTSDDSDGEYYGDASSIAAQGTVVYDFSSELPYSGLPSGCTFTIKGDAPGASLLDTENNDFPESRDGLPDSGSEPESQVVEGIDTAVLAHADIISESYGYQQLPGQYDQQPAPYSPIYAANDAAVAAGVTVVVSAGDSGSSGTVSSPATDPNVIAVGATNTLRLVSQAYGYSGWLNNDVTPLSSGGTAPNNRMVDLVAPGFVGEAACSPSGSDCPSNTNTESFGGTSESCPFVAGAAADAIQAYRDSHDGASPTPALVKSLLTSTATDLGAPADEQGAGLLNVYAAVKAAQQAPGTTDSTGPGDAPSLTVNTPSQTATQLDLSGDGGSTANTSVQLYNNSTSATTVTGTYRSLTAPQPFGATVTESVSAPNPTLPVPAEGAAAAAPVTFTVPAGLAVLDADMIWPDASNGSILSFTLLDPEGRVAQLSYDYGTPSDPPGTIGTVPDIQHVEVTNPEAGTWTAKILWANGRAHLQDLPNAPGSYTGNLSFRVSGQNYVTASAAAPVSIPAHSSVSVPLSVAMPSAPGDHPESVDFSADDGAETSVPVARRTLIPSPGGTFQANVTSTVGRQVGGITTFDVPVAAGRPDLKVAFSTPDTSADDPMTFYLISPDRDHIDPATALPEGSVSRDGATSEVDDVQMQTATLDVPNPEAGTWEIDVMLNLTTSGKEFSQLVNGTVFIPQTVTFTTPSTGAVGMSETLSATGGGSTQPVQYSLDASTTNAACTLSGGVVHYAHVGHCVIDGNQAADATHTVAPQVQQTITVGAGSQAITFTSSPSNPTVGGTYALTATGGASGNPVTFSSSSTACHLSGATVTFLQAGSCQVEAAQLGDADYSPAPPVSQTIQIAAARIANPKLTARITSAHAKTRYGWYRSAVTIRFTCATSGSPLTTACPKPVVLSANGARQKVTRTIRASDGGTATLTVKSINIDTVRPKLNVAGVHSGDVYNRAPAAHCVASDKGSGIASCTIKRVKHGSTTHYTATASDRAGNTRTVSGSYRVK